MAEVSARSISMAAAHPTDLFLELGDRAAGHMEVIVPGVGTVRQSELERSTVPREFALHAAMTLGTAALVARANGKRLEADVRTFAVYMESYKDELPVIEAIVRALEAVA